MGGGGGGGSGSGGKGKVAPLDQSEEFYDTRRSDL